jgi:hypothetical protein
LCCKESCPQCYLSQKELCFEILNRKVIDRDGGCGWGVYFLMMAITLGARSETRTVFARSNIGVMGSNLSRGMDVCVCVILFLLSCRYRPCDELIPVQGVLPDSTVCRIKKPEERPRANKRA